jgi:hypothetical protein
MHVQPGGAGTTFYIGEARCNICYGQVCSMCSCPCFATLGSAKLLVSCMYMMLSSCRRSTAGHRALPAVCWV